MTRFGDMQERPLTRGPDSRSKTTHAAARRARLTRADPASTGQAGALPFLLTMISVALPLGHVTRHPLVSAVDIAALPTALAATVAGTWWPAIRTRTGRCVIAIVALITVAWIANPSADGLVLVVRLVAAAVSAVGASRLLAIPPARPWLTALAVASALEVLLALLQVWHGHALGLTWFGEIQRPVMVQGTRPLPRGTFSHPYVLAGFALATLAVVVVRSDLRWGWAWAVGLGIPLGLTFSRSAAFALVGLLLVARRTARHGDRRAATVVAACIASAAATGILSWAGWQARADQTLQARGADVLTSYRVTAAHDALDIVSNQPVLGVGPARGVLVSRQSNPDGVGVDVAHNVPLLVAVEAGAPAGVLVAALLVYVCVRAVRAGPRSVAVLLCYLPFFLFDNFPYASPQGLFSSALWAAALSASIGDAARVRPFGPGGVPPGMTPRG